MTTHDALNLMPHTAIFHRWHKNPDGQHATGVASPEGPAHARVVWDDLAECDSLIANTDRVMLAAIEIAEPKSEAGY